MTEIKYDTPVEIGTLVELGSAVTKSGNVPDWCTSFEIVPIGLTSKNLARLLFINYVYQQIVNVHGVVMDFGTRYGTNAVVFSNLRSIYEPFNRHRKVVAFDTFEGFPSISSEDGNSKLMTKGNLALPFGYDATLREILRLHEQLNPAPHVVKHEVVKGDVCETLPAYFSQHPETIVALAYLDMDLYKPTKFVLEAIRARLTRGSVVVFDELCDQDSPGETQALMDAWGSQYSSLCRVPWCSRTSYLVV